MSSESKTKVTWREVGAGLCMLYSLLTSFAFIVFNYQFAQTHSFLEWVAAMIFWLPIKAFFWPIFIFLGAL